MGFEEKVTFDYSSALGFINREELAGMAGRLHQVHQVLHEKTGPGRDYLGWLEWPLLYDRDEFTRVKDAAERIQKQSEVLVVVGIGGSYLGARAGLEMLLPATAGEVTGRGDRKSTRLNSSHVRISYAVFCLKKKKMTKLMIMSIYDFYFFFRYSLFFLLLPFFYFRYFDFYFISFFCSCLSVSIFLVSFSLSY